MSSVDNRIVNMEFNNSQFESGVKTSLGTIEKLKQSLNFTESIKNLTNLKKSTESITKNISLDSITDALESVTSKFSIFGTIGDQVIRELTSKVMGLVYQMTALGNSFTITPIFSGWGKYEDTLNAQQQILNATAMFGKNMEDVEKTYDKLSWYSDETNYSTQDMINALAQFTSAGVSLEESEKWILGIANAAAFAGVTGQKAAHAFQGWAQAISRHTVDTRAWMWIQTSGMATSNEFKQIALDAAVAVGTLKKVGDEYRTVSKGTVVSAGDFTHALSEGWFNQEVMGNVFSQFGEFTEEVYKVYTALNGEKTTTEIIKELGTDMTKIGYRALIAAQEAKTLTDALETVRVAATAKWTGIYKAIFGNYDESKKMWTDLAEGLWDVFVGPVDELKIAFEKWHDFESGGFLSWVNTLYNICGGLVNYIDAVKEAFDEMFPIDVAEALRNFAYDIGTFAIKFKVASEDTEKFSNIFKGFFSVIKLVGNAFSSLWRALEPVRNAIKEVISYLTDKLSDLGVSLSDFVENIIGEDSIFNFLKSLFSNIWTFFSNFAKGLDMTIRKLGGKGFEKGVTWFERLEKVLGPIGEFFSRIAKAVKGFFDSIEMPNADKFYNFFIGIYRFFQPFINVLKNVKSDLGGVFGTLKRFFTNMKSGLKITRDFMGEESAEKTSAFFTALNNWLKPLGGYYEAVREKVVNFFKAFVKIPNSVQFFKFFKTVWGWINKVKDGLANLLTNHQLPTVEKFRGVLDSISKILSPLGGIFNNVREAISNFFSSLFSTDEEKLAKRTEFFEKIGKVIDVLWQVIKGIGSKIGEKLGEIGNAIVENFTNFDIDRFLGLLASGGIIVAVQNFIGNVIDPIRELFNGDGIFKLNMFGKEKGLTFTLIDNIQSITDTLWSAEQRLEASTVRSIAVSIAILAASLVALSLIDREKLINAAVAIGVLAAILAAVVESMGGFFENVKVAGNIFQKSNMERSASALIKMAAAVLILAIAIRSLAKIEDPNALYRSASVIVVITVLMAEIMKMKVPAVNGTKSMAGLIAMAISIRIAASAIAAIAKIDKNRLWAAVGVVAVLIVLMAAFVKFTQNSAGYFNGNGFSKTNSLGYGTAVALVGMAASILIMVAAIYLLGSIKTAVLQQGVIALTAVMAFVAVYFYVMSTVQHINLSAVAFIGMAIGIAILAGTLKTISKIKGDIGSAVIVMGVMAAIIGLYLVIASQLSAVSMGVATASFIGIAVGFVILAGALLILSPVLKMFSQMGMSEIGSALLMLLGAFATFYVGLTLMEGTLKGAAALIVVAGALLILAPVLKMFSKMGIQEIGTALLMLLGVFLTFYVVAKLFDGAVTLSLLKFGAALLVIGAAVAIAGVGISLLASGFALLATTFSLYSSSIVGAVKSVVYAILEMLPVIVEEVGRAAITLAWKVGGYGVALVHSINDILGAILDLLEAAIPRLIEVGIKCLVALLEGIDSRIYLITVAALSIIGKFIIALAEKLPDLVNAGIQLMISFINSLARGIEENTDKILNAIDNLMVAILTFAISALQRILTFIFPTMAPMLNDGLEKVKGNIKEALGHEEMEEIGEGAGTHLANGILHGGGGGGTFDAGEEAGEQGAAGFESTFNLFGEGGKGATDSLIGGMETGFPDLLGAGGDAADWSLQGFTGMLNDGEFKTAGFGATNQILEGELEGSEFAESITTQLTNEQLDAMVNSYPEFKNKGQEASGSFIEGFELNLSDFSDTGELSIDKLISGADSKDSEVYGSFMSISETGADAADNANFYGSGENSVFGIAKGARSQRSRTRIYEAYAAVAYDAMNTVNSILGIASPSKEFAKIGNYTVLGFINGVSSMEKKASDATRDMGEEAINGISNSIKKITDFFDSTDDARPVITPVLDLSNIESGANTIPGLFGDYSMGIMARTNGQMYSNRQSETRLNDLSTRLDTAIAKIGEIIQNESDIAANTNYQFEIPFSIDGRELARASAVYNQEELNRLTRNIQRKEGYR